MKNRKIFKYTAALLIGGIFYVIIVGYIIPPEPETCALCGGRSYHAPCVLELSTGTLTELAIYAPDPLHLEELAEEQNMDVHVFCLAGDGWVTLTVQRTLERQRCSARVPASGAPMDRSLFCRDCRRAVAQAAGRGFVLLDLRNTGAITAYPLAPNALYTIRDYTVSITEGGGEYTVEASAELF